MPIWLQQLITALLWVYVGWQLLTGRTMKWGKKPGAVFNGVWVDRAEEPGTYWIVFAFNAALVGVMTWWVFLGSR